MEVECGLLHSLLGSLCLDIGLIGLVYGVGFVFADAICAAECSGCGEWSG